MIGNVVALWLDLLLHHGLIGPVIALVAAVFVLLLVGNAIIWPLAGVKRIFAGKPAEDPKVSEPV